MYQGCASFCEICLRSVVLIPPFSNVGNSKCLTRLYYCKVNWELCRGPTCTRSPIVQNTWCTCSSDLPMSVAVVCIYRHMLSTSRHIKCTPWMSITVYVDVPFKKILYSWHWQQTSAYHPIESSRNVMNPHLAPEGWLCCICKSVSSFCLSVNSHDDVDYCTNFFCIFYTFYSIHYVDRDTCVTAS